MKAPYGGYGMGLAPATDDLAKNNLRGIKWVH